MEALSEPKLQYDCTDVYNAQFPIHDVVEELTACTRVVEGGSIGEEVSALQIDPHVLVGLGSTNGTGICRCGYTSVDPDIGPQVFRTTVVRGSY